MAFRGIRLQAIAGAAGLAAMAGALTPAQAQFFFGPPVLPEHAVVHVLRDEGFRRISPPILNRDVYFMDAIDPYGEPVRLIVNAYNGHIVRAHVRSRGPWLQAEPDDWDDEIQPRRRSQPKERPQNQAAAPTPRLREPAAPPAVTPAPPKPRQPAARSLETPTKPAEAPKAKPPVAAVPQGTRSQPRVIEMAPSAPAPAPVAPLDDAAPRVAPPTPYVPPAALD